MNSTFRPSLKFKSIHGEGITYVEIVDWDSLANPLAVETETCDGSIVLVCDGVIACDGGIASVEVLSESYLSFCF